MWGVAEERGAGTGTQSVPTAGQVAPEATLASGPSLGEWVTLYFLHLSGKGDENGRGLQPLETNQGPGILRICLASQMECLQHQRKMVSTEIYTHANQCHLGLGWLSTGHVIRGQGEEKERGSKGFQGLIPLAHLLEEKQGHLPQANMAPPRPKPHVLCALRKRESVGLAGSPLVSRKG